MNVLILGASSFLGAELAVGFAPGNHLILTGRDSVRLKEAANLCSGAGAVEVRTVVADLGAGIDELLPEKLGCTVDLMVHVASATSRLRDQDVRWSQWLNCLMADVYHPLALVRAWLAARPGQPLTVCLISSFLADLRSPGRLVYGGLKSLHEQGLLSALAECPDLSLRVLKLGRTFPRDHVTGAMAAVAARARALVEAPGRCEICSYGLAGRVWKMLYFAQPLVFKALNCLQRSMREALAGKKAGT